MCFVAKQRYFSVKTTLSNWFGLKRCMKGTWIDTSFNLFLFSWSYFPDLIFLLNYEWSFLGSWGCVVLWKYAYDRMFHMYYMYYIMGYNMLWYDYKILYEHDILQEFSTRYHIRTYNLRSLFVPMYFLHASLFTSILYWEITVFFIWFIFM